MSESQNKHGCLFYAFICFIVLIALVIGVFYYFYKTTIVPVLSSEPQIVQIPVLQPEKIKDLTYDFNKQIQAVKERKETTITYTQDEINYLINHQDIENVSTELVLHPNQVNAKTSVKFSDDIFVNLIANADTDLTKKEESKVLIKTANTEEKILFDGNLKELLDTIEQNYKMKITNLDVQEGKFSVTISPIE